MRFTITKKLILFNVLLLIFMILVGFFGINGMTKINHVNKQLDETWIPAIQETHSLTYYTMRLTTLEGNLLLTEDDDEKQSIKEELEGVVTGLQQDIKEFEQIVAKEEEYNKSLAEMKELYNGYLTVHQEIMEAVENNDEQKAKQYLKAARDFYFPLNDKLYGLVLLNNKYTDEASSGSMKAFKAGTIQTYMIIAISILLSVAAIFYLLKIIAKPLTKLSELAKNVADGNLVQTIRVKSNDEIGDLAKSLQEMCTNLQRLITNIKKESEQVSTFAQQFTVSASEVTDGSSQIAITMNELAKGAEEQASSTTALSEMMKVLSTSIQKSSENGEELNDEATEIRKLTNNGFKEMEQTKEQMEHIYEVVKESADKVMKLDRNYQEISKLVLVIQSISEQTNLLALNAAIEAARAGEHGKGFSVVASEVRKLSEQVAASVVEINAITEQIQGESKEVTQLLENNYEKVEQGSEKIKQTSDAFQLINQSVINIQDKIKDTANELISISESASNINQSIENIAAISEESSASVEQTAAVSEQSSASMSKIGENSQALVTLAERLMFSITKFKL